MKPLLAAAFLLPLLLLLSAPHASAQTTAAVTYKCWVTLHGGNEREYTVPANLSNAVTFPIEIPEYGRVLCHMTMSDAQDEIPNNRPAFPASLQFSVATIQQLEPGKDGSYTSVELVESSFAQIFNKRVTVLDTPAYSLSFELLKN